MSRLAAALRAAVTVFVTACQPAKHPREILHQREKKLAFNLKMFYIVYQSG